MKKGFIVESPLNARVSVVVKAESEQKEIDKALNDCDEFTQEQKSANHYALKKENELLKIQNHQLKSELFKLNKDSQFFNNYVDKDLVLLTSVSDLDISSRLLSVFRYKGIETLRDIVGYSKRDFFYCRNFGNKSLLELETMLQKHGFKLNEKNTL